MQPLDATIGELRILGTIAGFVPDAARLEAAFREHEPTHLALGVPPIDVDSLAMFAAVDDPASLIGELKEERLIGGSPGLESIWDPASDVIEPEEPDDGFAPLSDLDHTFLTRLAAFGETRLPSPDLMAAHALAQAAGVPLAGIDMDDHAHSDLFAQLVKVRHLVQRQGARKKALAIDADTCAGPYDYAIQWDQALAKPKPLAAIERAREGHMAEALRGLSGKVVAVVPAARFQGVVSLLSPNGP